MARIGSGQTIGQTDVAKNAAGSVSVGASDVQIVPANAGRVELVIGNDHATQVVYLSLGSAAAVANKGIRLGPGQTYVTNAWTGEVRAFASGAATVVTFAEV